MITVLEAVLKSFVSAILVPLGTYATQVVRVLVRVALVVVFLLVGVI